MRTQSIVFLDNKIQLKNYLLWAFILGLLALASLIVLPFIIAILSAYLLAYMTRPLYVRLVRVVRPSLASFFCIVAIVTVIVVPLTLLVIGIVNQAAFISSSGAIADEIELIIAHPLLAGFHLESTNLQNALNDFVAGSTTTLLSSLPSLAIGLLVTLFGTYFMLIKWQELAEQLKRHIPFEDKEKLIGELDKTTRAILYGTLAMAALEFAVALFGFYLLGIEAGLIVSAIIFVLAFIPSIGPIMIWAPMALYYGVSQDYYTALGVTAIGLILTIGIEVILYAKWIGDRTIIHPFVMMIGVIGGIALFGIFGFIFGPLLLASALDIVKGAMQSD